MVSMYCHSKNCYFDASEWFKRNFNIFTQVHFCVHENSNKSEISLAKISVERDIAEIIDPKKWKCKTYIIY